MITYRPGLPTLYEFPDVDPDLAFVNTAQPVELLPTPAPQALVDPVATAIAAADARGGSSVPVVDQIATAQEPASAPADSPVEAPPVVGEAQPAPVESAAPVAAPPVGDEHVAVGSSLFSDPTQVKVESFVKPIEAPATAPFPADVQPAATDALLQ